VSLVLLLFAQKEASPMPTQPPAAYVFFDVDGTLISIKSMFSFHDYFVLQWGTAAEVDRRHRHQKFQDRMAGLHKAGAPREALNTAYYEFFCGLCPQDVATSARAWFAETSATTPCLYLPATCARLALHRSEGVEPVFVSGSLPEILAPLADALGVNHILATDLELVDGRYSGRIRPPQTIGAGKAEAIQRFLSEHGVDSRQCLAYGDDRSDQPMLEAVGHPRVVAGDPVLEALAAQRGWPVLAPHDEDSCQRA